MVGKSLVDMGISVCNKIMKITFRIHIGSIDRLGVPTGVVNINLVGGGIDGDLGSTGADGVEPQVAGSSPRGGVDGWVLSILLRVAYLLYG